MSGACLRRPRCESSPTSHKTPSLSSKKLHSGPYLADKSARETLERLQVCSRLAIMNQEKELINYEEDATAVKLHDQHARHDPHTTTTQAIGTQKHSAMAQALLLDPPRFWSRTTLKLFACLFVTYLCSAQNGFDSNTFGGVSAMPNFKAQFGTNIAATNGFLAALYVIGKSQFFFCFVSRRVCSSLCRECHW